MNTRALSLAVVALAIAGCGGGGGDKAASTPAPTTPPEHSAATPEPEVDAADLAVVRAWADTLRRGDVAGASEKFALPSLVSNGTSPIRLRTREQVRFFNRTLPCGAKVMDAEVAPHRFMIVTFTLTERPGKGSCGTGAGQTARTAFRVRDGLITDWLRVPDEAAAAVGRAGRLVLVVGPGPDREHRSLRVAEDGDPAREDVERLLVDLPAEAADLARERVDVTRGRSTASSSAGSSRPAPAAAA